MKKLVLIGLMGCLASCSASKRTHTLDEHTMVLVLHDLMVSDEWKRMQQQTKNLYTPIEIGYVYSEIFKQHGVSATDFFRSYTYYLNDIEQNKHLLKKLDEYGKERLHFTDSIYHIKKK